MKELLIIIGVVFSSCSTVIYSKDKDTFELEDSSVCLVSDVDQSRGDHLLGSNAAVSPELRAAWIATVFNIDWPTKSGLSVEEMRSELYNSIHNMYRIGINCVIMQVRPHSDAFYKSSFEPWSKYLTGVEGVEPEGFDPLAYAIQLCHERGMELHAWFNPYRVSMHSIDEMDQNNPLRKYHSDWLVEYGGKVYLDPGVPEVSGWVTDVVTDVVSRYDIDAVHFDDYFYPYRVAGVEFPDADRYMRYGSGASLSDWRRSNVDRVVQMISNAIKASKPWVQFGISPFGVWRNSSVDPAGSVTEAGMTNYDDLYADVLKWQREGWIDYLMPQLYWPRSHPKVPFNHLLDWWGKHTYGRGFYVGLFATKMTQGAAGDYSLEELLDQVSVVRADEKADGSAFFSAKVFDQNIAQVNEKLALDKYRTLSLIPPSVWIESSAPSKPKRVRKVYINGKIGIAWNPVVGEWSDEAKFYAIYRVRRRSMFDENDLSQIFRITDKPYLVLDSDEFNRFDLGEGKYYYKVVAVDRCNNRSKPSSFQKI